MNDDTIYLDNNATTAVDPTVLDAMLPFLKTQHANPASNHGPGRYARNAVENARSQVAALIDCEPKAIVFTSGATESNNLAIHGTADFYQKEKQHIVTCKTEHPAVLDPCKHLEERGTSVTRIGVDENGRVNLEELEASVTDDTLLVSIMLANNETGVLQDISAVSEIAHSRGAFLHCDAAQACGKIPVNVDELGVDLMSISAHKMYGPKGIGALYVRRREPRVRLTPLLHGGGQERDFRSGTLNTPAIVGFGKSCELTLDGIGTEAAQLQSLRDQLEYELCSELGDITINGLGVERLPGTLSLCISGIVGAELLDNLPKIAASVGAACTTAVPRPSHVLRAMDRSPEECLSGIRLSIGRFNTRTEISQAAKMISEAVTNLRANGTSSPTVSCSHV